MLGPILSVFKSRNLTAESIELACKLVALGQMSSYTAEKRPVYFPAKQLKVCLLIKDYSTGNTVAVLKFVECAA